MKISTKQKLYVFLKGVENMQTWKGFLKKLQTLSEDGTKEYS